MRLISTYYILSVSDIGPASLNRNILHICATVCVMLQKELAKLITLEQGKTLADAEGDVFRGLRKSQGSFKSPVIESRRQTY